MKKLMTRMENGEEGNVGYFEGNHLQTEQEQERIEESNWIDSIIEIFYPYSIPWFP